MPDNVPPPKPNPSFTVHQPGESSPGLQDLATQAEAAASALSRISDLEAAIMARYQQAFQAGAQTQQAAEQVATGLRAVAQAEQDFLARVRVTQGTVEARGLLHRAGDFPLTVFPQGDPNQGQTTREVQRVLDLFQRQRQGLEARLPIPAVTHSATPPVLPTAPLPLLARTLTEQLRTAPLPLPEPPPETADQRLFREKREQERADVERGQLRNVPPPPNPAAPPLPTPGYVAQVQAHATATGQSLQLPGHGLIQPEPLPLPPPPSPLAARLQASPVQRPDISIQQPRPAPMLEGLAARMLALQPPGPQNPLPPELPSAGISGLQARLRGPLTDVHRQAYERMEQQAEEERRRIAEEPHRQDQRQRDQMRERTAGYQQEALQSRIEARTLGGPESQAMTAALVQAQALAQTNQMRQQAQVAQAQATHAAAPEGRQQIQEQLQARQQTLAAQEARQRAEAIAQYGQLSVALGEVRERLGSFGGAVSEVAGKGLRFGGVGLGMANVLGGMASPQMAGTVQESASLLGTRMGRSFLPLMETEARVIQGLDRRYQELERGSPRAASALTWGLTAAAAGWTVGGPIGAVVAGGTAALAAASGTFEHGGTGRVEPLTPEQQLRLRQMQAATRQDLQRFWGPDFPDNNLFPGLGGGQDDIRRSWRGLPQGQTMGGFEYAEMVQQSGLNVSPLQAEQERLQLENVVGLLQQVADNTRNLPNVGPAWR